jgi:hypothetical protein
MLESSSQHLTSTIYYEKNKEKVDSILFINTHVSSKSNIALFKLIDLNKKNIDFQQLLLLKKRNYIYLISGQLGASHAKRKMKF